MKTAAYTLIHTFCAGVQRSRDNGVIMFVLLKMQNHGDIVCMYACCAPHPLFCDDIIFCSVLRSDWVGLCARR